MARHRPGFSSPLARPRGGAPLAPAGEAGPRARGVGSARPAWVGWVAGTFAGRRVLAHTPAPLQALPAPHPAGSRHPRAAARASPGFSGRRRSGGGEAARPTSPPPPCDSGGRRRRFIDLQRRRRARDPPKARHTRSERRRAQREGRLTNPGPRAGTERDTAKERERKRTRIRTEGGVEKGTDVGADRGGPQTAETETALGGRQGGAGQRLGGRENTRAEGKTNRDIVQPQ